jgi:ribose 5-phosphate isomerase B
MKIYLAADHAGFAMKEVVKTWLMGEGYTVEDCGAHVYEEGDDYPDYMHSAAQKLAADVSAGQNARAVIFGASGQGEAIVANRYKGVRAAVYYGEPSTAQTDASGTTLSILDGTRAHNNANCLSIGARFISDEMAKKIVGQWLTAAFSLGERHVRRITKIDTV